MKSHQLSIRYPRTFQLTHFIVFQIILWSFLPGSGFAQLSQGGTPLSFSPDKQKQLITVPYEKMESVDVGALMAEDVFNDKIKDQPWRFGKDLFVNLNPENSGVWNVLKNGDRLWRLGISSKGALSINLTFDKYKLPEGASMFIYNQNQSVVLGSFTSANNQKDRYFAVSPISGESIIIEYYEPAHTKFQGEINLWRVTHGYRDINLYQKAFESSGICNVNAICPEGDPIRDEIRSVAMIILGGGLCSGALINNTNNDGAPLFLSANHCYSDPGTVVFRFNWESESCSNPSISPLYVSLSGATQRARNSDSDFWLMELNQTPPIEYNVYYSGWNRTASTSLPGTVYGIHHPAGDIKKISWATSGVSNSTYLNDAGSGTSHWRVGSWSDGTTTEPGSSGSPLYDAQFRIIGQLHGGYAACGNTSADWYGNMAVSWDGGGTSSTRLSDWLDPAGTNAITVEGYEPGSSPNAGDDCADPVNLFGLIGNQTYTTTGLTNNYSGSCEGDGEDKVFYLNTAVPDGSTLSFWVSSDDYNVVLYGRYGSCTGTEIACVDEPDDEVVSWENTTGSSQNLWIFVDGNGGDDGSGTINWEIDTPAQLGEDCSNPISLSGSSGTFEYTNTGFTNNYYGLCGGSSPDVVLYLEESVPHGSALSFWTSDNDYDIVLYGKYGSCQGDDLPCVDDPDGSVLYWYNNTGSEQNIWIIADGYGGGTGSATLNWEISSIELDGDDCTSPVILTGSSGIETYSTVDYTNDYSGNCGGSGADKIYYLNTAIPDGWIINLWTTDSNYDVIFYAYTGNCEGYEIGCIKDVDGTKLSWENTTGAEEYVWIYLDGDIGDNGEASINWSMGVVPNLVNSSSDNDMEVFPNPASEILYITSKYNSISIEELDLYDCLGKVILKKSNKDQGIFRTELDISEIKKGLYVLEILTKEKIITKRIVIL